MRRPALAAPLLALAAALAACDSDGDAAAPPAPEEPTIAEVCGPEGLFARLVTRVFACSPEVRFFVGTPEPARLAAACDGNLGGYVADGTLVVGDRAALDACVAYVEGASCEELDLDEPNPCAEALLGTVAAGGACEVNTQCEGDAYCDEGAGTSCGSCKELEEAGADCSSDQACAGGRCRPSVPGGPATCQELADAGEACAVDKDCRGARKCLSDGRCGVPPVPAQGDACDNGVGFRDAISACGSLTSGHYCKPAPGGSAGTCEPFAALGDPCVPVGVTSGAAWCNFPQYEACKGEGGAPTVCVAPVTVEPGQPCDPLAGAKCAAGLRCGDHDGDPGTPQECHAPLLEGAACDPASNRCDLFLTCDGTSELCEYEYTGSCPSP